MINIKLIEKALNFDESNLLTNISLIEAFGERVLNNRWCRKRGVETSEYLLLSNVVITIRKIRGKKKVTVRNAS